MSETLRCLNCNKLGHERVNCTEQRRDIYCSRCRSSRHAYENCPSVWRCYTLSYAPLCEIQAMFCYNCARAGHYGDECNSPRPMNQRRGDDSAFCNANLSRDCKMLRKPADETGGLRQYEAIEEEHRRTEDPLLHLHIVAIITLVMRIYRLPSETIIHPQLAR